ncbi:hypothetical protein F511_36060 [Dorcoceras hygrometricum]|uniref:Uncharacterized protein n=1 Tax=Dorcoceras hygrometricum TaxID=472368 RepID=A0A2Z7BDV9_9LAMI|nr:hypothetical protein F511_36060 [Dorcoceras hygrometricum]
MKDVVEFFHSSSLKSDLDLESLRDLKEKEKLMLDWAEASSLETAVRRRVYMLAKYIEMLLRKFLDSHRKYYTPLNLLKILLTIVVLEETSQMGTDEEEQLEQTSDETNVEEIFFEDTSVDKSDNFERWLDESYEDFGATETVDKAEGSKDIVGANAPEKAIGINQTDELGSSIAINEVQDTDWYYASLPRISIHDKGKEPLEEFDIVKGNPVREMVALICGYVEFLVQLRDQPWTATATQIIDLLSVAHSNSLEDLLAQQKEHGIIMDRPSSSQPFKDLADNSGAVLTQFYYLAKYTCWLASGPTIYVFTQEEQSYFVQSPESPPPSFQRRDSSTSFTDSHMHFNIDDIPLDDTADYQFSLPAISSAFSASLDDLRTFLSQRIDDSQNDILSRLNTLDRRHRDVQILHLNEFKKGVLAHGASVTADLMEVRKEVKELDAKVTYLDGHVAAIRSELFDFQAKVAEKYLNLSTQLGDLVDYIRGGDSKKGEGSSSRPQPPPDDQGGGSGGGNSGCRTTDIVDRFSGSMSIEDRGRGRSGERRSSGNISGHSNRRRYDSDEHMDLGPSLIPRRSAKFWCTGKD